MAILGQVRYKRAYGDFTNEHIKKWKTFSFSKGIKPEQVFSLKNKNSSDIALVIDAMELIFNGDVDIFCIATSDSDFCRLAQVLKEYGKYV